MDINQISYFIEVCNTGSISRAAEILHLSQQGLSASIRRLERELGCDLFYRKASSIVLTEAGKMVYAEANGIKKHVDRIYKYCSNDRNEKYLINIALTEGIIVRLPVELQRLLINGNSEFTCNLMESYSPGCCKLVGDGDCSMAIIYGETDDKKFDSVSLDAFKQVIIVNRDNPLAQMDSIPLHELDNAPMVITCKGTYPYNNMVKMFSDNGVKLNIAYECDRPRQTIELVVNNPQLSARIVADELTEQDYKKVKALEIIGEPFMMPLRLITKHGYELNMFERIFRRLIIECYK